MEAKPTGAHRLRQRVNATIQHRHTRSTPRRSHLTAKLTGRDPPTRYKAVQAKSPPPEQQTPENRNGENPVNLNPKNRPLPRTTAQPPHREARTATTPPESYLLARRNLPEQREAQICKYVDGNRKDHEATTKENKKREEGKPPAPVRARTRRRTPEHYQI